MTKNGSIKNTESKQDVMSYKLNEHPIQISNVDIHDMVYSSIDACLRAKYLSERLKLAVKDKDTKLKDELIETIKQHNAAIEKR